MVLKKYRVVRDNYCGYEVQTWRFWFPFWVQGRVNTHRSIEEAKEYIKKLKDKVVYYEE
jgi:hypothetical protein